MKVVSIRVDEQEYAALKALAARRGRPVAEIIRESLARTAREAVSAGSFFDLSPLDGPRQVDTWSRADLYEETREP